MKFSAHHSFTLLLSFLFFSQSSVHAQQFAVFGELSAEEIQLKQCSFDPDANAVVLLHEAYSDYDESYHLVTKHHIRIKILKEKGLDNANVNIPYWRKDDFEFVDVLNAATININADGVAEQLRVGQKSVFTKKLNDRVGEVAFSFPSVKVGSILEYEYRSTVKHYGGLEDWYFQEERPVMVSKYTLVIVPNTEFAYSVVKRADMPAVVTPIPSSNAVFFEMDNIPGLGNEPYMDSRKDYLQKVWFQLSAYGRGNGYGGNKYMTSWDEVNRELLTNGDFGGMLGKNIPGTDEFIKSTAALTTDMAKMEAVYNYVRSNISWNAMHSKFAPDGLKTAWQKKSGTSAEMNFILINLLREAGLQADPLLVSERLHGRVDTQYPFIDQFNAVIAAVTINGNHYYLDARNQYTPARIIPDNILNTTAFLVKKKTGGLVKIADDTMRYSESVFNDLTINADGSLDGKSTVTSEQYARVKKISAYIEDKTDFIDDYFKKSILPVDIKNFDVLNADKDSLPFQQLCTFSARLSATGDYTLVPLHLFGGFTKNPFTNDNRFSNVNFGYKRSVYISTTIKLPENLEVESVPKSIKLTSEQKDIVMVRLTELKKEERVVNCTIRIDFSKSLYELPDYGVLKSFYTKMFELLDEPLLLKKK